MTSLASSAGSWLVLNKAMKSTKKIKQEERKLVEEEINDYNEMVLDILKKITFKNLEGESETCLYNYYLKKFAKLKSLKPQPIPKIINLGILKQAVIECKLVVDENITFKMIIPETKGELKKLDLEDIYEEKRVEIIVYYKTNQSPKKNIPKNNTKPNSIISSIQKGIKSLHKVLGVQGIEKKSKKRKKSQKSKRSKKKN